MKQYFYIGAFVFLGILVSQLFHAIIEIPLLGWITRDPDMATNMIWQYWPLLHGGGSIFLLILGAASGFLAGRRYWQILYVEHQRGIPRW